MVYNLRWREAVISSIICHLCFFIIAAYLSAHILPLPIIEEKYVEIQLANEPQLETVNDSTPPSAPSVPNLSPPMPQSTPQPARLTPTSSPSPSITTAPLSMVSAEVPVTSSGNTVSNSSTETSGSGITTNATNNTGTKSKGSGVIPPSILNKIDPIYPQQTRQAGIEGTVLLKIQILTTGRAGSISVSRSSGNEQLDSAAIAAVNQWSFVPAKDRDSGQAVTCYTTIPISFHLLK